MNTKVIGVASALAIFVIGIIIVSMYVSYSNTEIELRKKTEAQQQTCEAFFDKVWKIISQKAEVTAEYKESFKDVYSDIMTARYSGARGGALMSWIQEHNPNFDSGLYKDIQLAIETQRDAFFIEQKKLISYKNQHDVFVIRIPQKFFIGGRGLVDIVVITSAKTEQAYKEGKEELEPLFNKK